MKETTALDFRYGIRTKDEKKQKVNIYELGKKLSLSSLIMLINTFEQQSIFFIWLITFLTIGGGRTLSSLLAATLTSYSISSTAVCIVLDLSSPGGVIDSL